MSVDLPSSTEPAVASRRMSITRSLSGSHLPRHPPLSRYGARRRRWMSSEVALPLAVFHRGLSGAVVRSGLPALGVRSLVDQREHHDNSGGRGLNRA